MLPQLFNADHKEELKAMHPDATSGQFLQIMKRAWKLAEPDVKATYEAQAKVSVHAVYADNDAAPALVECVHLYAVVAVPTAKPVHSMPPLSRLQHSGK